jgi:hypothetical protein
MVQFENHEHFPKQFPYIFGSAPILQKLIAVGLASLESPESAQLTARER